MTDRNVRLLRWLGIATLATPMIAFALMRLVPGADPMLMAFSFHFYVVVFTALAAAAACAVIIAAGRTLRETRLLFLGLAFFSIAGIFAVHGLATPGFLVDRYYGVVVVSAWLSLTAGAAFVAASVVDLPPRVERLVGERGWKLAGVAAASIVAYLALGVTVPQWLDWVPYDEVAVQYSLTLFVVALFSFAIWRYYQAYAFARLPSQLAMVAALVLLVQVQAIILWGPAWHLSWWLYHGLYVVAFAVLFVGWAMEVWRAGTLRAIADALAMRDALAQLGRGLDAPIVELVDAIETKDAATAGHVDRVSRHALAIGRRLDLSPAELRSLVLGARMHDVGKISVPTSLLVKPAPLTADEFAVVKTHTVQGHAIAQRIAALRGVAEIVRHHHERVDGGGYPDGLAGEEIPLLARIISVADTYDAMISGRPYRDAVSHVEAMAELFRVRGEQLDPRCVEAFAAEFAETGTCEVAERAAA